MEDKDRARREAMYAPLRAYMEEQKNWTPEQKAQFKKECQNAETMLYHTWMRENTEQK